MPCSLPHRLSLRCRMGGVTASRCSHARRRSPTSLTHPLASFPSRATRFQMSGGPPQATGQRLSRARFTDRRVRTTCLFRRDCPWACRLSPSRTETKMCLLLCMSSMQFSGRTQIWSWVPGRRITRRERRRHPRRMNDQLHNMIVVRFGLHTHTAITPSAR